MERKWSPKKITTSKQKSWILLSKKSPTHSRSHNPWFSDRFERLLQTNHTEQTEDTPSLFLLKATANLFLLLAGSWTKQLQPQQCPHIGRNQLNVPSTCKCYSLFCTLTDSYGDCSAGRNESSRMPMSYAQPREIWTNSKSAWTQFLFGVKIVVWV